MLEGARSLNLSDLRDRAGGGGKWSFQSNSSDMASVMLDHINRKRTASALRHLAKGSVRHGDARDLRCRQESSSRHVQDHRIRGDPGRPSGSMNGPNRPWRGRSRPSGDRAVEFPNTAYFSPVIYAMTGAEVRSLRILDRSWPRPKPSSPRCRRPSVAAVSGTDSGRGMATLCAMRSSRSASTCRIPSPTRPGELSRRGTLLVGRCRRRDPEEERDRVRDGSALGSPPASGLP